MFIDIFSYILYMSLLQNDVEPYYEAYEAFAKVINSSPYIVSR